MSSLIGLACCVAIAKGTTETQHLASLLDAIRFVETGGMAQSGDAVGDGGRSIGPYQISHAYWVDSGVPGSWRQCRDRRFAEAVMLAYWKRYCPEALRLREFEILARIHNGGPRGDRKAATVPYWLRIRDQMGKGSGTQAWTAAASGTGRQSRVTSGTQ